MNMHISKDATDTVLNGVIETVMGDRGTAYRARVDGILVGGKLVLLRL